MEREEILAQSRKENKEQDLYEQEVIKTGNNIAITVAACLATIFFIIQILTGGGMNYGLYAVLFSMLATTFIVKVIRLKRKHEIFVAVLYSAMTILSSIAHILNLVSAM